MTVYFMLYKITIYYVRSQADHSFCLCFSYITALRALNDCFPVASIMHPSRPPAMPVIGLIQALLIFTHEIHRFLVQHTA